LQCAALHEFSDKIHGIDVTIRWFLSVSRWFSLASNPHPNRIREHLRYSRLMSTLYIITGLAASREVDSVPMVTGRAWVLKEALRGDAGRQALEALVLLGNEQPLAPMIAAAKLIAQHLPNLLTFFTPSHNQRRG
jgi:hypothetical protein